MAAEYAEFAALGMSTVYEAAGRRGLIDVELTCLIPGTRVAGPARTVACAQDDNLMVHAVMERVEPGDVVVITMPEPRPVALVGELLATQAAARGAAALLIDASIRDVSELRSMGLPIWARYVRARGARKAIPGALDVPVTIGGTTVAPRDLVVLDDDGACALPAADAVAVLGAARERAAREAVLRQCYAAGALSYDLNGLRSLAGLDCQQNERQ